MRAGRAGLVSDTLWPTSDFWWLFTKLWLWSVSARMASHNPSHQYLYGEFSFSPCPLLTDNLY